MKRKIVSILVCIAVIFSLFSLSFTASAKTVNKGKIEIPTISAVVGDEVVVPIYLTENPGIMAISISITYNSEALELVKMTRGDVLKDKTSVAQKFPEKNLIRFVHCEKWDTKDNGILFSLYFRVKDNAEYDLHPINIQYGKDDFCNWYKDQIMPKVVAGGVDVAFNGNNCSHKKYSDWEVVAPANCEEEGTSQRYCKKCGHVDSKTTKALGHEYSKGWTIDKQATEDSPGTMARYCTRCSDFVDQITFNLKESEKEKIENTIGTEVPKNDFTEKLFKKQHPGEKLTPSTDKRKENSESTNILVGTDEETPSEEKKDTPESETDEIISTLLNFKKLLTVFEYILLILSILII